MRDRNINYVIVGLFVVAMTVAAIAGLAALGGRTESRDVYVVVLDNVADLKFGTQVRYEGYPVGQVEAIRPVAEGGRVRFLVEVSVTRGWRIPPDSVARIGASSLLAAKTIDIEGGRAEGAIAPGGRIASAPPRDVFAAVSRVADDISALNRESVKPLIDNVSGLVSRLGGALERDMGSLLVTLNDLAATVEQRVPPILVSLESFATRLDATVDPLQEILSADNTAAVRRTVGNLDAASADFAALARDLGATVRRVDALVAELDDAVRANRPNIDKSLTDVRYALRQIAENIGAILNNLDGTSRNMNEFSRLIRQNPGLLLGGTARPEVSPARRRGTRAAASGSGR